MFLYNHNEIKPIDNVAFSLFGINVYWYGVLIVLGAVIALLWGLRISKHLKLEEDILLDGFIWGLIIGVIGARLWYVIFEWNTFKGDLSRIINIRSGGLAIHGAIVAAAIFIFFYCKHKKVNIFKIGEIVAPGFLVGQIFGRWGNFFNQEAHGGLVPGATLDAQRTWLEKLLIPDFIIDQMYITNYIPKISEEVGYYHPTFLYESLWNIIGLVLVILLRKFYKKYWVGDAVSIYLMWYSVGRFFIEGMRTDPLMVGGLRAAQLTSIALFIVGLALLIVRRVYKLYPVSYMDFQED